MLRLALPGDSAEDVFKLAISKVRDRTLKRRLEAATASVAAASAEYGQKAPGNMLHEMSRSSITPPDISQEDMEKIYTQRMAKENAPARIIYDRIFSSSPQQRCPLCVHRPVATLDHHLPKAIFPALSVAPINLIPACSDCNKAKLHYISAAKDENPLHPYFDDLGVQRWLVAQVVEEAPAALVFYVARPVHWDDELHHRVLRHFRDFKLAGLYGSESADELVNIRAELATNFDVGGLELVRTELSRRGESAHAGRPNGWRAAAYSAWAASDWFCAGGFR